MSSGPALKRMVTVASVSQTGALKPSHDRKVAFRPGQFNNFGLLPGRDGTCPAATEGPGGCSNIPAGRKLKTCYVFALMKCYSGVKGVLEHNTFLMKNATCEEMTALLDNEFTRFEESEARREDPKLAYRLHWSGDVFNQDYADALVAAMGRHPTVQFWTYTRHFWEKIPKTKRKRTITKIVDTLIKAPNLSLYLSLDPDNILNGLECFYSLRAEHGDIKNLQLCYMAKENDFLAQAEAVRPEAMNASQWPEVLPTLSPCPVDTGKIPLVGGCAKCQKCIGLRQRLMPIWFKS